MRVTNYIVTKQSIRKCAACGTPALKYAHYCIKCGRRLPPAVDGRYVRTASANLRASAADRLLAGMRDKQCVCGLRGPHECTRTREWQADCLARLAAKRRPII